MEKLWQQVKSNLEEKIPGRHVSCWFQDTHIVEEQPNSVVLYFPNRFSQKWIEDNYLSQVVHEFNKLTGKELEVSLRVSGQTTLSHANRPHLTARETQSSEESSSIDPQDAVIQVKDTQSMTVDSKPRAIPSTARGLNHKYQFSNFIVGDCNRFAWTAAQEVCLRFQAAYNPLYVYSATGLGKTHLGQAIGHLFLERNHNLKIRWSSAEGFSAEMMNHLKNKTLSSFKQKYRNECDVLCLDDVHFLRGKKWIQTELCYTLDELLNERKQILLFGQAPPNDLEGFQEGLTSRMCSGLTARIYHPEKETRIAILKLLASRTGLRVPETILETIADTVHNHIRNLEGAFTRIVAMSSLMNRPIDQELTGEALKDFQEKRSDTFTLETIGNHVARYFQLDSDLLCARSRKQKIYYCRQIAMYLSRKHTHESLQTIGKVYKRDHASVFHAIQSLEQKMKTSSRIRREVAFIEEKLLKNNC